MTDRHIVSTAALGLQMLTQEKISAAMDAGFTYICASCIKLHISKDSNNDSWETARCMGGNCCGPGGGGWYPMYEGPLGENISKWCFRCGMHEPGHAVTVKGNYGRLIGVCTKHLELLKANFVGTRIGHHGPSVEVPSCVEIKK